MATNSISAIPAGDQILATLREHAPELKAAGISHLRLFGSAARGEATKTSDIDLLAEFDPERRITLVTLGSLELRLRELLGAQVELSSVDWMKQHVRENVLREAVVAF